MRFATASALAIALVVPFAAAATAQNYPSRTVTVVVPFPAGGSVDGVARIMVQKLNETMGQHFIVENRAGGASGIVGANAVAKASHSYLGTDCGARRTCRPTFPTRCRRTSPRCWRCLT